MGGEQPQRGDVEQVGQRAARHIGEPLAQIAEATAGRARHRAGIVPLVADEDAQQGGFAGTVRADQSNALAGVDGERDVLEEDRVAEALGEIVDGQHGHSFRHLARALATMPADAARRRSTELKGTSVS